MTQSIVPAVAFVAAGRCQAVFARCLTALLVLTAAAHTLAQDRLADARDLYRAAAYDDALARLETLRQSAHGADDERTIHEYRAFCLIALGRTAEAERAIEAVVTAAPSYHANESPRVDAAFREVRRRMLPGLIRRQYVEAKAAFDRHDSSTAEAGFQQVLDLLADSDLDSVSKQPSLSELRTLTAGFLDLSRVAAPPVPEPPRAASAPAAAPAPVAPVDAPPITRESPPAPAPAGIYSAANQDVVPPVVVRESWAGLADVFAVRTGVIEVVIDETGTVAAATMATPVNAVYDRLALTLAKRWRYKPATLDGMPVKYRKVILLDLTRLDIRHS